MKATLLLITSILVTTLSMAQNRGNVFSYKVGANEVYLLSDGQQSGNSSILIGATSDMISQYIPDGKFPNAYNSFLIKKPDGVILVDAGTGKNLFENLQSIGVAPEEIDRIYLTHMHGDHVGGLMRDGKPAFANAQLLLSELEYDYWTNDIHLNAVPENRRKGFESARSILTAYGNRVQQLSPVTLNELTNSSEAWQPVQLYGHTPGHTGFQLSSNGEKLFIWGDLTHAMAIQMPCPEVAVTYDVDPVKAIEIRKKALQYVTRENIPLAGMHIAYPGIGVVKKQTVGYQYTSIDTPL